MSRTLEPANVLLLLLNLDVVGDHVGKLSVDAPLVEVALEEGLQVLIEVLEGRTSVHALSGPVLLGSLSVGQVGLVEVGDLLNLEQAVLSNSLDQEGAVAGLLNGDVDTGREARLKVAVQFISLAVSGSDTVFGVLRDVARAALVDGLVATEVHLIESSVIEVLLLAQVLKVGDGEGEADPNSWVSREKEYHSKEKKICRKGSYSSLPNFFVRTTSCSPGTSLTYTPVC